MKGASAGEGLGNQFLSHIREVDAIVQVVRCFESGDIHHVSGTIDPVRDIEVINTELILADLASLQKRRDRLQKEVRAGSKIGESRDARDREACCRISIPGKPAITLELTPEEKIDRTRIFPPHFQADTFRLQRRGIRSRRPSQPESTDPATRTAARAGGRGLRAQSFRD